MEILNAGTTNEIETANTNLLNELKAGDSSIDADTYGGVMNLTDGTKGILTEFDERIKLHASATSKDKIKIVPPNILPSPFSALPPTFINDSYQIGICEMGQSNMEGYSGNNTHTIPADTGYFYNVSTRQLEHLLEDRGDGTGSHATYFASRLYNNTSLNVIPVMTECASDGSGMTSESNESNNWSSTGSLRASTAAKVSDLLEDIGTTIPIALWCQGEKDADHMDSNPETYTKSVVKTGMQDIINWWFNLYPNSYFFISQTGKNMNGDTTGYQTIRQVQTEICDENDRVYMAFNGAIDFTWAKMKDSLHYNNLGQQDMGESFADKIIDVLNL